METTVDLNEFWFFSAKATGLRSSMNISEYKNNSSLICPPGSDLEESHVKAILVTCFTLVFGLCFCGNLLVLFVILYNSAMRTVTNFFLANLAVADLLVGVFCVLQHSVFQHVLDGIWPFGDFLCRSYLFTLNFAPCASSGILLLVSLERYIAVLHPVKARDVLTKGRLAVMTALVWIISFGASVPFFMAAKVRYFGEDPVRGSIWSCNRDTSVLDYRTLVISSFLIWYVAALVIMSLVYTRIGLVLWKSANLGIAATRQGKNGRGQYKEVGKQSQPKSLNLTDKCRPAENLDCEMEPSAIIPLTSVKVSYKDGTKLDESRKSKRKSKRLAKSNSDADAIEARKKVCRLLISVVVTFALLILPHHIRQVWLVLTPKHTAICSNRGFIAFLQPISYLLEFLNSGIDPILYAFLSGRFRSAIKELLRCRNQRDLRRAKYLSSVKTTETSDFATTELSPTETKFLGK